MESTEAKKISASKAYYQKNPGKVLDRQRRRREELRKVNLLEKKFLPMAAKLLGYTLTKAESADKPTSSATKEGEETEDVVSFALKQIGAAEQTEAAAGSSSSKRKMKKEGGGKTVKKARKNSSKERKVDKKRKSKKEEEEDSSESESESDSSSGSESEEGSFSEESASEYESLDESGLTQ